MNTLTRCILTLFAFGLVASALPHMKRQSELGRSARNDSGARTAPTESYILDREKRVWEAIRNKDAGGFGKLVTHDLVVVTENGVFTRSEFLRSMRELTITEYSLEEPRLVQIDADVVALIYKARFLTSDQDQPDGSVYETTVWVRRAGVWLAALNQETPTR